MKHLLPKILIAALTLSSCSASEQPIDPADGTGQNNPPSTGNVVFGVTDAYPTSGGEHIAIKIYINEALHGTLLGVATVSANFTCGTSGTLTVELPAGLHNWYREHWHKGKLIYKSDKLPLTIEKDKCIRRYP